jgi:hypothetical protein
MTKGEGKSGTRSTPRQILIADDHELVRVGKWWSYADASIRTWY